MALDKQSYKSEGLEPLQDFGSPSPKDRVKYGMLGGEGGMLG